MSASGSLQGQNPDPTEKDPEKRRHIFEQFLQCLDREENLTHYRMSWGLQCNLALFAAVFALESLTPAITGNVINPTLKWWGTGVIAATGLATSVLAALGVRAAHRQTDYLKRELEVRLGIPADRPGNDDSNADWRKTEFIRPFGHWELHHNARKISAILPLIFGLLWFLIILWAYPHIAATFYG